MTIKSWPTRERPREKLLHFGASQLSDAELLAIFLRTGIKGRTAVDLARDLIKRFGSLAELLSATQTEFCSMPGLGEAKFAQLQAVVEMHKRHQWHRLKDRQQLCDPATTRDFLKAALQDNGQEIFACVFMDVKHRVIRFEELFRGTIDAASVYPREVLKYCLKYQAAAVIFAHNHPSGIAEPSHADKAITQKLVNALQLVDIRVLDHFIIAKQNCYSFAENGLIGLPANI